jgi:formylglycine-generating enzyme required for sulfatase activity
LPSISPNNNLAVLCALALAVVFGNSPFAGAADQESVIKDCDDCPPMVVIPAGSFVMGSTTEEREREKVPKPPKVPFEFARFEQPQHTVVFAKPFAIGKYEVSRALYARFVAETGHPTGPSCWAWDSKSNNYAEMAGWVVQQGKSWKDPGFPQTDDHPVVCVDFAEAKAFAAWLSKLTGQTYRLPTEAEWEYAARGGTSTTRPWGNDIDASCRFANVADDSLAAVFPRPQNYADFMPFKCDDGIVFTAPVESFLPNQFGLHNVLGNAAEWIDDCFHEDYIGAPADGSASRDNACALGVVVRGGSWFSFPWTVRSAHRVRGQNLSTRYGATGFRLVREIH